MKYRAANKGFTLIELLITLSVAGIILTIAAPSYRVVIQDSQLIAQSNSFHSALMLTKSEAVKRNSAATICISADGLTCTGGTVWSNGWLVFADTNNEGVVDAGEQIIQVGSSLSGGNTLNGNNGAKVTFSASGFTTDFATFSLCDDRGAAMSKRLILNRQGRLQRETGGGAC